MNQAEWSKVRRKFLKGKENHQGYYICENCSLWIKYPDVHHKKKRSTHPELASDPNNLSILCHDCHLQEHNQI